MACRDCPKLMKNKTLVALLIFLAVAACGPGAQKSATPAAALESVQAREALPIYDSRGVIAALDGMTITLDHAGASAAGLAPGRSDFTAHAYVLADAPVTPGARVDFSFIMTAQGLELTELKTR
jgi:hypothetical protein